MLPSLNSSDSIIRTETSSSKPVEDLSAAIHRRIEIRKKTPKFKVKIKQHLQQKSKFTEVPMVDVSNFGIAILCSEQQFQLGKEVDILLSHDAVAFALKGIVSSHSSDQSQQRYGIQFLKVPDIYRDYIHSFNKQ